MSSTFPVLSHTSTLTGPSDDSVTRASNLPVSRAHSSRSATYPRVPVEVTCQVEGLPLSTARPAAPGAVHAGNGAAPPGTVSRCTSGGGVHRNTHTPFLSSRSRACIGPASCPANTMAAAGFCVSIPTQGVNMNQSAPGWMGRCPFMGRTSRRSENRPTTPWDAKTASCSGIRFRTVASVAAVAEGTRSHCDTVRGAHTADHPIAWATSTIAAARAAARHRPASQASTATVPAGSRT